MPIPRPRPSVLFVRSMSNVGVFLLERLNFVRTGADATYIIALDGITGYLRRERETVYGRGRKKPTTCFGVIICCTCMLTPWLRGLSLSRPAGRTRDVVGMSGMIRRGSTDDRATGSDHA